MSTRQHRGRLTTAVLVIALATAGLSVPAIALTSEACPTSIPASGFNDLAGLGGDTIDAIDCVVFYGISKGTSTTTFSPGQSTVRWQMALFLIRTAEDLGIGLPDGTSQGFTDISAYPAATQTAINQLAQLGLTQGTGPGKFSPEEVVARWQMALFLTRLYAKAGFGLPSGAGQGFTDISTYPAATQTAINQIAQLGVGVGTAPNLFSPATAAFRWQMALFLARELEVGKAKPYTVTMTASVPNAPTSDTVTLTITVRKADGSAAANIPVDVFVGSLASNGTCVLDTDGKLKGGDAGTGSDCRIDSADPKTNNSGVATVAFTHTTVQETNTVFAWIGETNETFDSDTVRTKASVQVIWGPSPTAITAANVTALFASQATIRVKLVDGTGASVPLVGQKVVIRIARGASQIQAATITTGADGSATFSYVGPPDPSGGNDPVVTDTATFFWDKDNDGTDDGAAEFNGTSTVTWDDGLPRSDTVVLTTNAVSSLTGTQHSITIRVTDNSGVGVSGAVANWTVSGANTASGKTGTTNSSGVVSFTYTGANPGVDDVDAEIDLGNNGSIDIAFGAVTDLAIYNVEPAPALPEPTKFDILATDAGANTIDVVSLPGGSFYRLKYDSNFDTFTVSGTARSLSQFESSLAALTLPDRDGDGKTELETDPYGDAPGGASSFILRP